MTIDVGDRVKLAQTENEYAPVGPGDTGEVWRVTPIGIIRVKWDNGSKFDLDPESDKWEVISKGHEAC